MRYKIQVSRKTKIDIKTAKEWYEKQSLGLGDKFEKEIIETIDSLLNPIVEYKAVLEKVRRILVVRFPYAVYYYRDETKAAVKIIAVLHNKQSLERLRDRL